MKDLIGKKIYITATIGREGYKKDGETNSVTICLVDIRYDGIGKKGTVLRDHLWINKMKRIENLNLKMDDRIELSGTVIPYKSRDGKVVKYRLSKLRDIGIVGSAEKRINEKLSDTVYV